MTEWSFPFADNNGDRAYSDADFAKFFSAWFANGVFINVGGGLKVSGSTNGMNVTLKNGAANINGRVYYLNDDQAFSVPVASNSQDRTDSIVIRLDLASRIINAVYKQSDTTVTRNDNITELQIAKILVPKSSTVVAESNITDMRSNETVCGLASPTDPIDVGEFTTQYEAIFNSQLTQNTNDFTMWFENLKSQLDSNQASNLQNQIDENVIGIANLENKKVGVDDVQNVKNWETNKQYKTGDLVFVSGLNLTDITKGQISGGLLRCLVDHVSGTSFPSSDDNKWKLLNISSYTIKGSSDFAYQVKAKLVRIGNVVSCSVLDNSHSSMPSTYGGWINGKEKLPQEYTPAQEHVFMKITAGPTQGVVYGLDITSGGSIRYGTSQNIGNGFWLHGSDTWTTQTDPTWQGGAVS